MPLLVFYLAFLFLALMLALVAFLFFYVLVFHIIPIFSSGTFYAASTEERIETMVALANVKPGDKAVDLGSGDGRLVIALAQAGAESHGYEINPFLVAHARKNIKKAGLGGKAFIHVKSFLDADFSQFNVVVSYCVGRTMATLEPKLQKELPLGSRVISNHFVFPHWQYAKKEGSIYLYKKSVFF